MFCVPEMTRLDALYEPRSNGSTERRGESEGGGKQGNRQQSANDNRFPPEKVGHTPQRVATHETAEHVSATQIAGVETCFCRKNRAHGMGGRRGKTLPRKRT